MDAPSFDSRSYYTVPKFGGSFLLQALPPLPGCTAQRLLVTNYTEYGLSSRVSAFNITQGPASEYPSERGGRDLT